MFNCFHIVYHKSSKTLPKVTTASEMETKIAEEQKSKQDFLVPQKKRPQNLFSPFHSFDV
jgi:hypothetical protein